LISVLNTFKITCPHQEHRRNMTEYSFYAGPSPAGGSAVPGTTFKICAPHVMFGAPVAAYIQNCFQKMCPPCGFWTLAKSWRRAWFHNSIRYRNAKTR